MFFFFVFFIVSFCPSICLLSLILSNHWCTSDLRSIRPDGQNYLKGSIIVNLPGVVTENLGYVEFNSFYIFVFASYSKLARLWIHKALCFCFIFKALERSFLWKPVRLPFLVTFIDVGLLTVVMQRLWFLNGCFAYTSAFQGLQYTLWQAFCWCRSIADRCRGYSTQKGSTTPLWWFSVQLPTGKREGKKKVPWCGYMCVVVQQIKVTHCVDALLTWLFAVISQNTCFAEHTFCSLCTKV